MTTALVISKVREDGKNEKTSMSVEMAHIAFNLSLFLRFVFLHIVIFAISIDENDAVTHICLPSI